MRPILAASLLLNVALGIWLFVARPESIEVLVVAEPAGTSTLKTPDPASLNLPSAWAAIESTDFRLFAANLRATGCPEQLIRDLLLIEVHKSFLPRKRAIAGDAPKAYWQKILSARTPQQQADLRAVRLEEQAVVRSLVPDCRESLYSLLAANPTGRMAQLSWLPPEKRDAVARVFDEEDRHEAERPGSSGDWGARERRRRDFRLRLLKDVLSPDELEEYRIRISDVAEQLRNDTLYGELTPEEFKAVLTVREKYEGEFKEIAPNVRKVLGEERAAEFEQKTNWFYRIGRQIAERYALPEETAVEFARLHQDSRDTMIQILRQQSISREERNSQWVAALPGFNDRLVRLVGPKAAKAVQDTGLWLQPVIFPPQ